MPRETHRAESDESLVGLVRSNTEEPQIPSSRAFSDPIPSVPESDSRQAWLDRRRLNMHTLQEEFSRIEIGRSSQFRNLTLFPVTRRSNSIRELDYLLLEDGIAQGKVMVTELHAGGSVPELRLENNADLPVLLVDGEELVGAKQNRVLNLTILAPAKQVTVIPVSCVEAGRWGMSWADLKTADHMMYALGRGERLAQVTASMRSNGTHKSDQHAVWRNIAAKAMRLKASSPTGAMSAIFESQASSLEEFTRAFSRQEGQC